MEKIIFVYNADSGILNAIKDLIHKNVSPASYACRLCTITYDNFGMIQEWKEFVKTLNIPTEFLHKDELEKKYKISGVALPAVFMADSSNNVQVWIDAQEMNDCQSLQDLKSLVSNKLANRTS